MVKVRMNVLNYMKSISIKYTPFEAEAKSLRLFVPYVLSVNMQNQNPECKVDVHVEHEKSIPPEIHIEYMNGMKQVLPTSKIRTIPEILSSIDAYRHRAQLIAAANEPEDDYDTMSFTEDAPSKKKEKEAASSKKQDKSSEKTAKKK